MHNLELLAAEAFQILRAFDYTVVMYNDEQDVTYEPEECRFFVTKPNDLLLAIQDENDNSHLSLILTKSVDIKSLNPMIQTLRVTADKYNTLWGIENTDDDQIDVKKYGTKAAFREGKNYMIDLVENMYGTSMSSYVTLGEARIIIRHNKRIEEDSQRGRNIKAIFVQNPQGERRLMETNNLMAARALARHVNEGGSWADSVGQYIVEMATDFRDLGQAVSFVDHNASVITESTNITERCRCARKDIREMFASLYRQSTYETACQKLNQMGERPLVEGPVLENLRETLRVEGKKELPESVLAVVARAMNEGEGERAITEDDGPVVQDKAAKSSAKAVSGDVAVLGRKVSGKVWEKFKKGEMDMRHVAELPTPLPPNWDHDYGKKEKFSTDGKAIFALEFIVPLISDGSLSNLVDWCGERLGKVKDQQTPAANKYRVVVYSAVRAAKLGYILEEYIGARGVDAVRELAEWFRGFDPHRILMEEQVIDDVKEIEGEELEESELTDEDVVLHHSADEIILPKKSMGQSLHDEVASHDPVAISYAQNSPALQPAMRSPMPMAMSESKEWDEGKREAEKPNGSRENCPYPGGEKRADWMDGFGTEADFDEEGRERTDEMARILKNAGLKR